MVVPICLFNLSFHISHIMRNLMVFGRVMICGLAELKNTRRRKCCSNSNYSIELLIKYSIMEGGN